MFLNKHVIDNVPLQQSPSAQTIMPCCLTVCVQEGYRTLCVAYKKLSDEEYVQAEAGLREARLALQDREEQLMAVYNQVETGMSLIGATAVEDRWVTIAQ